MQQLGAHLLEDLSSDLPAPGHAVGVFAGFEGGHDGEILQVDDGYFVIAANGYEGARTIGDDQDAFGAGA